MKFLEKYEYLIILILIVSLAYLCPLTGIDLFWANFTTSSLSELLAFSNGNIIISSFLYVLSKYKMLKLITYALLGTSLFILIKNFVNKKNGTLAFIALFLFFLLDKPSFAHVFVSLSGFIEFSLSSIVTLLYLNIITKDKIDFTKTIILISLGLLGTLINPHIAFLIFTITLIHISFKKDTGTNYKSAVLLASILVGLVAIITNSTFEYTGLVHNLFYEFLPALKGSNYLITLLTTILILFEGIKYISKKKDIYTYLSIIGMITYLILSKTNVSYNIYYISLIIYLASTYYILTKSLKSVIFKRKLIYLYLTKIAYVLILLIFGNINIGSITFLSLLNIVMILEIYNSAFPSNFLKPIWIIATCLIAFSNIYIYNGVAKRYEEMNFYIKNKLECTTSKFTIPKKYENDYIENLIPKNKEEIDIYIKYHNINVYNKEPIVKFEFSK